MLDKLYRASPAWLQSVGISAYGLHLRRVRFGREFDRLFEEFMRRQWDSAEALREYQNERLRRLIAHAYENVPYYRRVMDECKLRPGDIRGVADLPKFPVLRKAVLRREVAQLRSRHLRNSQLFYGETSGTTGSPFGVYWDHNMVIVNAVVEWRQKDWAGLHLGDRIATLMLSRAAVPAHQNSPPFWRHNWPMKQLLMSALHMRPGNFGAYVEKLQQFKPDGLEAYPSAAYLLARHMLEHNVELRLRSVLTTSEPLFSHQRAAIEKAFGCKAFNYYGMAERVVFATECDKHTGLHLNADYGITEILNDDLEPVPPGTQGRITGTSLYNFAMPLIRCVTDDTGALSSEPCPCGRNFPLLAGFEGRSDDCVITPDGRIVTSTALTGATDPIHRMAECQIIQDDPSRIRVRVVKGPGYSGADTQMLTDNLTLILGRNMNVHVELVEEIPRTSAGKYRWIVSRVFVKH